LSTYLRAPNYLRNLRKPGFDDIDWTDDANASGRLVDAIVVWGSADQNRARVDDNHAAGADHVCVQVLRVDEQIPLDEWRVLADALITPL
jgi:hypothetical protein